MPPTLASFIFGLGILGLFWLDRDNEANVSKALWVPTVWLMLIGSRPVSFWLGMAPTVGADTVYAEGSPIDRAVFTGLVTLGLAVLIARRHWVGPTLRRNWPVVLFFSFAALSILWSDYAYVTFKHWIKGIGDVAVVLIVLTEPSVTDALKRLITRLAFTLLPLSVLLCKYYGNLGRVLTKSWTEEYTGVTTQKNSLGAICMVLGLGVLWRLRAVYRDREDPARSRRLLALGAVLTSVVWLLWKCNSLTSICALTMGASLMLGSTRPAVRRRPALVHLMFAAMLFVAVYALFFQSSATLVQDLGRDATFSGRTQIWSKLLSIPNDRLVGAGYESFWLGARLEKFWTMDGGWYYGINEAHSGYVEMLLNLGWIGVALLGILTVVGYRNAIAAWRRDPYTGGLGLALLLGALISAFTEAAFRMMYITWVAFLLAATVPQVDPPQASDECGFPAQYQMERREEVGTLEGYSFRRDPHACLPEPETEV